MEGVVGRLERLVRKSPKQEEEDCHPERREWLPEMVVSELETMLAEPKWKMVSGNAEFLLLAWLNYMRHGSDRPDKITAEGRFVAALVRKCRPHYRGWEWEEPTRDLRWKQAQNKITQHLLRRCGYRPV